ATGIVNHLTYLVTKNAFKRPVEMIDVESEFSAISAAIGAEMGGVRAFTATSSQGLMMMAEATYFASGMRIPLVMAVVNRGLSAPVTIFADHQDSMTLRDNSWLQFYVKDVQEALDTIIMAYRIAEDENVLLPVMVNIDGFYLSHLSEKVLLPSIEMVENFLPEFEPKFPYLDVEQPIFLGTAAWPDYYAEFVYAKVKAMEKSQLVVQKVHSDFSSIFNRKYSSIISYPEDLTEIEFVIIGMGSMMGTLEVLVDNMRKKGVSAGLIRVRTFRPFPKDEISALLAKSNVQKIGVIDRSVSPGGQAPLFAEVSAIVLESKTQIECRSFILGIGGRDVTLETGEKIIKELIHGEKDQQQIWIDVNRSTIERWQIDE
ncbi:MAG: pyruvate ferredoxin oxidoreductase, partial [Candidatus Hodarchaeales archaeon]